MQSSMVVAGMDAERILRKHFDTSGKSAAQFHHRTICKTPMALSDNGFFGAIAGKKSLPTIEVAPARHSEGSPDRDRAGVHVTVVDVPTHLGSISRSAAGKSEHAPSIKAWPTPASNRIGVLPGGKNGASSETSASRPLVEAHRLMPSSEPLGVRMRLRRVLSEVGDLADRIQGGK
jgi:hypothetical protein